MATTILLAFCVLTSYAWVRLSREEQAIQAIRDAGGFATGGLVRVRFAHDDEQLEPLLRTLIRARGSEHLDIGSRCTDRSLTLVARMPWLTVTSPRVTDEGIRQLIPLTKLKALYLKRTSVTDAGLQSVAQLTELRALNLSGTAISDEGLATIRKLQNLEELNLAGTRVTDAGLEHLAQLPNLRDLSVTGTRVSRRATDELRSKKPKLFFSFRSRIRNRQSDDEQRRVPLDLPVKAVAPGAALQLLQ